MPELSDINYIRELLSRHGFRFSKSLGQNFIIDPTLCPRIAEAGGAGPGVCALEIGPGIGVLTAELARRADRVAAVELDRALLPILEETLGEFDNVDIVSGDALELDLTALAREKFGDAPFVVCANLPYYITSPVIMKLLESRLPAQSVTVMVQKEAALRMTAEPGTRECGAITAAIHYYTRPELLFDVTRNSFIPRPGVDSAVMRLAVLDKPSVAARDEALFFRVVKAAFCQRRKTLANSLSSGLCLPKPECAAAIAAAGLGPNSRAEELSLQKFAELSDEVAALL